MGQSKSSSYVIDIARLPVDNGSALLALILDQHILAIEEQNVELLDLAVRDLGAAVVDKRVPGVDDRPLLQLRAHQPQCRFPRRLDRGDAREVEPGRGQCFGFGAHHFGKAAEMSEKGLRHWLYIATCAGCEQDDFEQFVIGQRFGAIGDHPLTKALPVAKIVRQHGPLGELISALSLGVRDRSNPVRAIDLAAQRSYAIVLAGVEDPHMPQGIPVSSE
jgi:hypothetical protein